MKIGLLVCDAVRPEYQAEFGDYPAMFQRFFSKYELIPYKAYKGELPENVTECDAYVATGSSFSVYEDIDWIRNIKAFIRDIHAANLYFIGFCFGHQLMAEALGGKVEKAVDIGWCVGVHQFKVHRIVRWMRPTKTVVNFLMMCQDQVTELPKNAKVLGGNEMCPNAIIQVGQRMMSIQAHPEFSKAYNRILMEGRVDRMGVEKVENGIASLALPIDTEAYQSWVDAFLGMD